MENTRKRVEISEEQVTFAFDQTKQEMKIRLLQKGRGTFASSHEAAHVITEEYDEMKDAVRSNDPQQFKKELIDIAVGAIFAVACIDAKTMDW